MDKLHATKNRRLLVIDDNRAIHDDFRKILTGATSTAAALDASEAEVFGSWTNTAEQVQFEIDSAYQGQEGVLLVKKAIEARLPYAMAFVDVRMPPGWDGVETTRKMWALDPDLQIVLCSAYSDYSWGKVFQQLGDRDGLLILKKPFDAVEAVQLAHALTEKWWLHQQSRQRMEESESRVAERTAELAQTNRALKVENTERQQAEEELREQQERLEVALHGGNLGSWDWDVPSGRVIYSTRWAEMLGYAQSEIEPNFRAWETLLHADDLPGASKRLKEHLAGRTPYYDIEVRMRHKSGGWRWVHSCGKVVLRELEGRPLRMAGTHEDITARKQAEEDQAHRARLALMTSEVATALTQSDHLPEILKDCTEVIVRHADAAFARIWTLDPGEDVLKLQASAGMYTHLDGPHSRVPVGKFKIGLIAQEVRPHLTNTVVGDSRVDDQEWAKREGMVAFAGYPLAVAGRVVGVMAMFARHLLPGDTLQKLAAIADGVAVGIVRKKSEEALRESEERFRQLAENISEVFYLTDSELSKMLYVSPAYEKIWGRTCESLRQNPFSFAEAIHPDDRPRVIAALDPLKRAGDFDEEFRIIQPGGSIRWIRDRAFPIRNGAGEFYRIAGIAEDITEKKRAEVELEALHKQVVSVSHRAGMAEVATNVLHNVGNVLNSVNISVEVLARKIRTSRAPNLAAVAALLREHRDDLADFLTRDPRGQALPGYLDELAKHLAEPQAELFRELDGLTKNIEHIKQIVDMQQQFARHGGVVETLSLADLVEDAIRINAAGYTRHQVQILRQYSPLEPVELNKHKVLQILVNLLSNAKYALETGVTVPKQVSVRLGPNGQNTVRIVVTDNGSGIAPEILPRIFEHGFTTRKEGHGYGLHSGALVARELGGSLTGQSDGPNRGAVFTLELPLGKSRGGSDALVTPRNL
jgi:PAS domain S-box-containing protein